MAFPRLMADADYEGAKYRPYINTGGPLDIVNGKYVPTVSGGFVLSGGLGLTTAFIATANKYKSSLMNSTVANALSRFPDSQLFINDAEMSAIDKGRLAGFSDQYYEDPTKREAHLADLIGRIEIHDPTTPQGESLDAWFDYLKEIRDSKIKHAKDYEVETEIVDLDTGKPYRMLLPTFSTIDSWTEAHVKQLNIRNEEFTAETETSKQRTIFMEEGLKKAQLMRQLPGICAKGGIYLLLTGHLGKKFSIDGKPVAKDIQFMTQDETVKAMGPKFLFLMSSIFKIGSTMVLSAKDDKRESEYPSAENHLSGSELQRLMITLVRSKNAPSGSQTTAVSAQRYGVMNGLSYYDHLRENKYFGMGTPNKVRSPLLGDLNIGRTKIFDASRDYKVARALELTYQLFVIQSSWSMMGQPVDFTISIEKFAEQLLAGGNSYAIDDILNSRGWWTYKGAKGAAEERSLLTLPEAIAMVGGTYKPKWLSIPKPKDP